MTTLTTKTCSKCKETKELVDFYAAYQKKSYCKACGRQMCKNYKANNKAKVSAYNEIYKASHKEEVSTYNHFYHKENKKDIQARRINYSKKNPAFRMRLSLGSRLRKILLSKGLNKTEGTLSLLGCNRDFLLKWMIFLFQNDKNLTLDNYGKVWHIDHVIPCKKFNCLDLTSRIRCFNWTNLKPLDASQNCSKGSKLFQHDLDNHIEQLAKFIDLNKEEIRAKKIVVPNYDKYEYLDYTRIIFIE